VKPSVVGIERWPVIERGRPWKDGVCEELDVGDPRAFWRHILSSVKSWRDLEQPLVGAVEQLIDFVTQPG
jgi:hypothetical protein